MKTAKQADTPKPALTIRLHLTDGSVHLFVQTDDTASRRLKAYPLDLASGKGHVAVLSGALAKFGACARAAIDTAAKHGDADTADVFTEVSRGVDRLLWMVEAHTQAKD
jgi:starvation-inducible DNA-binding protein